MTGSAEAGSWTVGWLLPVGANADLVLMEGDPVADVRNIVRVGYTIRSGRVIYSISKGR